MALLAAPQQNLPTSNALIGGSPNTWEDAGRQAAGEGSGVSLGDLAGLLGPGIGGILGSLFGGNAGQPFQDAEEQLQKYFSQAASYQNPFFKFGTGALNPYRKYIQQMQDPSKFINSIMGQYKTSPQEQQAQQTAMRAAQNAASASGMIGSTPFLQGAQQNAANIANQYQQEWLNNVLGIHGQYGQGLGNMIGIGQNAANQMTQMSEAEAQAMAQAEAARAAAQQKQGSGIGGMIGGLISGIGEL